MTSTTVTGGPSTGPSLRRRTRPGPAVRRERFPTAGGSPRTPDRRAPPAPATQSGQWKPTDAVCMHSAQIRRSHR